jgi:hypothetical protein
VVGNRQLRVDNDGKVEGDQLAQDSREGRVRKFFEASQTSTQPAPIGIGISLIDDAAVRQLLTRAAVFKMVFTRRVGVAKTTSHWHDVRVFAQ